MILKVGLTGGIGSGKSTVAKIFEVLGIPVYYADAQAKRIMHEDTSLVAAIIASFGEMAYVNGMLNRPYIASLVFNNKQKLALLNSLVHPVTIADADRWMQLQTTPYAVKEAALIFESSIEAHLHYVIGVSAPYSLRVERVAERDAITFTQVEQRMQNQMPEEEKMNRCDFIIINDSLQPVLPQVIALHRQLLLLAHEKR